MPFIAAISRAAAVTHDERDNNVKRGKVLVMMTTKRRRGASERVSEWGVRK